MEELIPISEHNGKKAVSARMLHAFLESKQDFSTWIKNRIDKYDLVENQDYVSFHKIVEREIGATKAIEYALTIDCAKELSMVEGSERGKQARKYFIACEQKEAVNTQPPITLTKSSAESEVKAYFTEVLRLKQSGKEFPVNLELVWPLVYSRKEESVRALTSEFIEDVDYQVLRRNAENPVGGRPSYDYMLSVSCMEFFIARKVRPVFEVYRQVFHRVAEQKPLTPAEQNLRNAQLMVEHERRMANVESRVDVLEAKACTRPDYFTIVGYSKLHHIPVSSNQANSLGRKASDLCRQRGITADSVPDPRFGRVGMYPTGVLNDVFGQLGA